MKPQKPKKLQDNINSESHYSFRVKDYSKTYYKKLWEKPKDNNADTILNWLYNRGLVQNYIRKLEYETIDEETIQDIIQEMWLYLIEKKDKLKELYDTQGITGLTAYVSGIIARQVHSNSSQIYNKYKKGFKIFKHISDKTWEVFDNTGEMIPTNTIYLAEETDDDILIKNIYNGKYE